MLRGTPAFGCALEWQVVGRRRGRKGKEQNVDLVALAKGLTKALKQRPNNQQCVVGGREGNQSGSAKAVAPKTLWTVIAAGGAKKC